MVEKSIDPTFRSSCERDRSPHAEIELISLYRNLAKTRKGSDAYKQILQDIEINKESMDAHQQLFCALLDALDRERFIEIEESLMICEKRIQAGVDELLKKDLTFTEMMRLTERIDAEIKEVEGRLRKSRQ